MANDATMRADEAVASATNYEAGNAGGDCEAANTTTTAGNAGKNKKKNKPVEKATSSSTVGEGAAAAKSKDAVKGPAPVTREMWYGFNLFPSSHHLTRVSFPIKCFARLAAHFPNRLPQAPPARQTSPSTNQHELMSNCRSQMRALLESNGDIANNTANHALFERMFARCPEHSAPAPKPGSLGPVCGNPVSGLWLSPMLPPLLRVESQRLTLLFQACGVFGHTLSVCPVPTGEDGDMAGCFFCNVADHDADDW